MSNNGAPTPFIREWGDGPTVLFIHGLLGSTRDWDSVADVGTGFRGVAVDLIGFGKSPKPHDFPYDVEARRSILISARRARKANR